MVDFDDFDIGPQSDEGFDPYEQPEAGFDDSFADSEPEDQFDRGPWDDQAALDSVYGPEDDGVYDDGGYDF